MGSEVEQFLNLDRGVLKGDNPMAEFSLYPLLEIHLHSGKYGDLEANGDIKYVYIFSAIALFILLLACINFMNLATARSTKRAKEVGMRKVMGAYKNNLVNQFLAEALVISTISALLAVTLSTLLLPAFNALAGKSISEAVFFHPFSILILGAIIMLVGLMAGSYPAFYLSRFNPIETLKGKLNLGLKSKGIRSTLVVFQFLISISVITGTAVVYDQLSYIQNKKLGFSKDHVVMVKDAWLLEDKVSLFKNEMLSDSRIINGTIASFLPVSTTNNNNLFLTGSDAKNSKKVLLSNNSVDHDYIETLGIEMKSGRNFSRDFPSDSTGIVINEVAAALIGFDDPIGKYLYSFTGAPETASLLPRKILGVMKDFHFRSLKEDIGPVSYTHLTLPTTSRV